MCIFNVWVPIIFSQLLFSETWYSMYFLMYVRSHVFLRPPIFATCHHMADQPLSLLKDPSRPGWCFIILCCTPKTTWMVNQPSGIQLVLDIGFATLWLAYVEMSLICSYSTVHLHCSLLMDFLELATLGNNFIMKTTGAGHKQRKTNVYRTLPHLP